MAYIGTKPTIGNFQICDAISVVNGQAAYTMQVGSVNVVPQSANHMIVSLNGTIQKPNSSFTVSGAVITFSSNLATGDVIDFIQILGDVLDLGVPSDATVTTAKLATDIPLTIWQSSVKTSNFSASVNKGYWVNTTSGAITITLPGSASVGNIIEFSDYARTWGTNAVTLNTNSLNFQGNTSPNPVYNTDGQSVKIIYSGATQGWIPSVDDDVTLETPQSYSADMLIIAGGGGGGATYKGGGGGAGGYRTSTQSFTPGTNITVTVGAGGTNVQGGGDGNQGGSGTNSSISGSGITTITSTGGGGGATATSGLINGLNGGSGGGGSEVGSGGSGNTPSTTPSQGNNGGDGAGSQTSQGGGGGSGAVGQNATTSKGGDGGAGTASSITGSSVTRAGGGGGSKYTGTGGSGGSGGGADGGDGSNGAGHDATANTGGGGGGSERAGGLHRGGNGGSGIVILSVPTSNYSGTTTGSPTVTTSGSNTILQFTGSGSYTA